MPPNNLPQEKTGVISSIAFGGKGITRDDQGKVFFVPFTAIGERVCYAVQKEKKQYGEGELLKILEPSPMRTTPLCPYFTRCGGCQLQHLLYEEQVRIKQSSVIESLRKTYPEASLNLNPSATPWEYRRKIELTLRPGKRGFDCGYIQTDHKSLIEIEQCPIFLPPNHPVILKVATIAKEFHASKDNEGRVALIKQGEDTVMVNFDFKHCPPNAEKVLSNIKTSLIRGIRLSSPERKIYYGDKTLSVALEGMELIFHPDAFIQNHPEESRMIYKKIAEIVKDAHPFRALDLYSGIGISTLLIAPYCGFVDSVELSKHAHIAAVENGKKQGFKNCLFHMGFVEDHIEKLLTQKPTLAICNPPREGLSQEVCNKLSESELKDLIYISCHPATLARDLKFFKDKGFKWKFGQAFDMFPQTGHVETLVHIEKI